MMSDFISWNIEIKYQIPIAHTTVVYSGVNTASQT